MPFRLEPQLPVQAVKSYAIASPRDTHTRAAGCAEVGCAAQASGWETFVDESTDLGQRQAHYIRRVARRRFAEERNEHGITVFTFPPGETCFAEHRVTVDRPEIYMVRGGDHRGNPRGDVRIHDRPEHWVEDFDDHQESLKRAQR